MQRSGTVNIYLSLLLNWRKNFNEYKLMTLGCHLLYYEGYKNNLIELRGPDYQHNAHTQQRVTQMYKNMSARDLNSEKFFDYKVYSSH